MSLWIAILFDRPSCNSQSRSLIDRSFGRPSSCVAIDLWSRIDRSVVFRDDYCRFTVCVFCFRGLISRHSGPAGAKNSCDRAGRCVPVPACAWCYRIRM